MVAALQGVLTMRERFAIMTKRNAMNVPQQIDDRGFSGRWVVVSMFGFAVTAVGLLYVYWDLHTAPFRPLQEALAHEFEDSHPLVQGGQEKMHKGTPRVLRIVLRVGFDPNDELNNARVENMLDRIAELAEEHHGLANYETLEVHLVRMRPEQTAERRQIGRRIQESGFRSQ